MFAQLDSFREMFCCARVGFESLDGHCVRVWFWISFYCLGKIYVLGRDKNCPSQTNKRSKKILLKKLKLRNTADKVAFKWEFVSRETLNIFSCHFKATKSYKTGNKN